MFQDVPGQLLCKRCGAAWCNSYSGKTYAANRQIERIRFWTLKLRWMIWYAFMRSCYCVWWFCGKGDKRQVEGYFFGCVSQLATLKPVEEQWQLREMLPGFVFFWLSGHFWDLQHCGGWQLPGWRRWSSVQTVSWLILKGSFARSKGWEDRKIERKDWKTH